MDQMLSLLLLEITMDEKKRKLASQNSLQSVSEEAVQLKDCLFDWTSWSCWQDSNC